MYGESEQSPQAFFEACKPTPIKRPYAQKDIKGVYTVNVATVRDL
jgi:hypothetical protein